MRIQHNIMAMNAYRNYNSNTKALSKNLERLSSGYKINRAGDDAAGLAISEKMRAQITGLDAAQKNVKDGTSLVNTAEGAMQEIQDMLNRMVYLATQSSNGTYDNEVDRKNLQQEVDQLRDEINRIADSANFNGIKLMDGSLDADNPSAAISKITTNAYKASSKSDAFKATFINERPEISSPSKAEFVVSLDDLKITAGSTGAAANSHSVTLTVGGTSIVLDTANQALAGNADATASQIVTKLIASGKEALDKDGNATTTDANIKSLGTGAGNYVDIGGNIYKMSTGPQANSIKFTQVQNPADGTIVDPDFSVSVSVGADGNGKVTGTVNDHVQVTKRGVGAGASLQAHVDVEIDFSKLKDGDKLVAGNKTYVFKVGESGKGANGDATLTEIDLSQILKTESDMSDEAKLKAAMVKITESMDDGKATGAAINAAWTVGNGGLKGSVGTLTFQSKSDYVEANRIDGATSTAKPIGGSTTAGAPTCDMRTEASVMQQFAASSAATNASTSFELDASKLKEGDKIYINGTAFEFTNGTNTNDKSAIAVDLKNFGISDEPGGIVSSATYDVLNALKTAVNAEFKYGTNNAYDITIDGNKMTLTSTDNTTTTGTKENRVAVEVSMPGVGTGLALQIGDTSDDFNQLVVSIKDMHVDSLGIDKISIADPDGAKAAINVIRDAINTVSEVRGKLGAISNRLDHTANNLSVMAENIQDAESSIRDTDIANEMMSYTKNNILVQSAQAMLAQANQVPQGVLQLLQ